MTELAAQDIETMTADPYAPIHNYEKGRRLLGRIEAIHERHGETVFYISLQDWEAGAVAMILDPRVRFNAWEAYIDFPNTSVTVTADDRVRPGQIQWAKPTWTPLDKLKRAMASEVARTISAKEDAILLGEYKKACKKGTMSFADRFTQAARASADPEISKAVRKKFWDMV